jgi:RNA polymerase sigma-70 factor, ECF subfamily
MKTSDDNTEITSLLSRVSEGDHNAEDRVLSLLYKDLRRLAQHYLDAERKDHTLQATALVHEAYLRVCRSDKVHWQNRAHFIAVAARAMRRVLVDHARSVHARKREGQRVELDSAMVYSDQQSEEILALDEALKRLASWDNRQAQIVEMRFFGGLQIEEIANLLKVSVRTVKRDWNMARAWLYGELHSASSGP